MSYWIFPKSKFHLIRLTHIASIDSGIFTELRGGGFDAVFVHIRQENTCTVFSDCLCTRKANALRALVNIAIGFAVIFSAFQIA